MFATPQEAIAQPEREEAVAHHKKEESQKIREYKLYIWVRNDLGMNKGKIAAQVGHACWRLASHVAMDYWTQTMSHSAREEDHMNMMGNVEVDYEKAGEKKIIFKVQNFERAFEITNTRLMEDDTTYVNDQFYTMVKDNNMKEFTVYAALIYQEIDTREFQLL